MLLILLQPLKGKSLEAQKTDPACKTIRLQDHIIIDYYARKQNSVVVYNYFGV